MNDACLGNHPAKSPALATIEAIDRSKIMATNHAMDNTASRFVSSSKRLPASANLHLRHVPLELTGESRDLKYDCVVK